MRNRRPWAHVHTRTAYPGTGEETAARKLVGKLLREALCECFFVRRHTCILPQNLGRVYNVEVTVEKLTVDDFDAKVLEARTPVMVDFSATWCEPCRALQPILQRVAKKHPDVAFYLANADDVGEVMYRYKFYSLPTVAFFRQGRLVDKLIGVTDDMENELEELLKRA